MADSISLFSAHATDYHAERRRIVPCFDRFYATAVEMLSLRGGEIRRVLDLGAGTGLMAEAVLRRHPDASVVLLDGSAEMLDQAAERMPDAAIAPVVADLRDELPEGPFDAIVSALAIHHLEHADKRDLFARIKGALRPGAAFVNAEHVGGPNPWLDGVYRRLWREACAAAGASDGEISAAEMRMEADRSCDVATQLAWMADAGLSDCDCFFKQLHFAVLAGWRA